MDFQEQVSLYVKRIDDLSDKLLTEEATKTALILPFFSMMGYDVFNPNEFVPEFTADVGIKKGEKVDYAICINNEPAILIEAKSINTKLKKQASQLYRYFSTTKAKFAILTNGRYYKFYTDLDEENKMDEHPFLDIDMLNIRDSQLVELKKFTKAMFDVNTILNIASEMKYLNEFKSIFKDELENPSDEFTRFFLKDVYTGVKTKNIVDKFKPLLKKALNSYILETMSKKVSGVFIEEQEEISEQKTMYDEIVEAVRYLDLQYELYENGYRFYKINKTNWIFTFKKYKGKYQVFLPIGNVYCSRHYAETLDEFNKYLNAIEKRVYRFK